MHVTAGAIDNHADAEGETESGTEGTDGAYDSNHISIATEKAP